MRISDWSSDVCSADLGEHPQQRRPAERQADPDVGNVQLGADRRQDRLHRGVARRRDKHDREEHRHAVGGNRARCRRHMVTPPSTRSEENTSELKSLMRTSYAVFCMKKIKRTILMNKTTRITVIRT